MYVCFIDEAGEVGRFSSTSKDSQPAFILLGLFIPVENIRDFTRAFIELKRKFFPDKCPGTKHDAILAELKGSDLRSAFRKNPRALRHTQGFLDKVLQLLTTYNGKICGRIYVKEPDADTDPAAIYTFSMQLICKTFQNFLEEKQSNGFVISDSRDHNSNNVASHAIFTQMYKHGGDSYSNIVEMPSFGDSKNHAGIQVADILCSAFLFPMVMHTYCLNKGLMNVHVQPKYEKIRELYANKLAVLQYRYTTSKGKREGGLSVSDLLGGQRDTRVLFTIPSKLKSNQDKKMASKLKALQNKFTPA